MARKSVDLRINVDTGEVIYSDGNPVPASQFAHARNDQLLYRVTCVDNSATAVDLTGAVFSFRSRVRTRNGSLVAFSDNDQVNVPGDWAAADLSAGKFCIRVSFATTNLRDALAVCGGHDDVLPAFFELDRDGNYSFADWQGTLQQALDQGDDALVTAAETYYTQGEVDGLIAAARGNVLHGDGSTLYRYRVRGTWPALQGYWEQI